MHNTSPAAQETCATMTPNASLRKMLHSARTQDYKLFRTPAGELYPMVDYFRFMQNPQQALEEWKATYDLQPVERYSFHKGRRFMDRVCPWPQTKTPSPQ